MAEAGIALRAVTRAWITRYSIVGGIEVSTPVALAMPPETAEVNPGVSLNKLKAKALKGASQTVFTFDEGREATISMQFAAATTEMTGLITGRRFTSQSNVPGFVYHEVRPTATTVAAQTDTTTMLYDVAEQTAAGAIANKTQVYRIDAASGLTIPVTVIDFAGAPANADQVAIGDNFALKFHADAVTNSYTYYFKVAAVFASATVMGSEVLSQVGVTLWGITLNGSQAIEINAPRCSLNLNGSLSSEPQRQIELEILTNSETTSDLGYDIKQLPKAIG